MGSPVPGTAHGVGRGRSIRRVREYPRRIAVSRKGCVSINVRVLQLDQTVRRQDVDERGESVDRRGIGERPGRREIPVQFADRPSAVHLSDDRDHFRRARKTDIERDRCREHCRLYGPGPVLPNVLRLQGDVRREHGTTLEQSLERAWSRGHLGGVDQIGDFRRTVRVPARRRTVNGSCACA